MKPGRKLDALVAEKVMGKKYPFLEEQYSMSGSPHTGPDDVLPHFSTDITAAWLVVEKFAIPRKEFWMTWWGPSEWHVKIAGHEAQADTPAHAICLAVLEAIGE